MGKFSVLKSVIKPVMIPVFVTFVLVADNRYIDVTAILKS
jgi:hypothetical protein